MSTTKINSAPASEYEILNNWIDDSEMNRLFTHLHVDADAAFSAALIKLVKPDLDLSFVPADTSIDDEESLGVDMLNGNRTVKGLKQGSAFGLIVHVLGNRDKVWRKAFGRWAKQINITDSGKYCKDSLLFVQLVSAWQSIGLTDEEIVSHAQDIMRGHLNNTKRELAAKETSNSHPIVNGISIIAEGENVSKNVLFTRGAKVVIRHGENTGICLLLSSKEQKKGRSLCELKGLLPKHWFIHPAGFIAAHGTKKAPKKFSTCGTSLEDLVELLDDWLSCPNAKEVEEIKAAIQDDLNWGEE